MVSALPQVPFFHYENKYIPRAAMNDYFHYHFALMIIFSINWSTVKSTNCQNLWTMSITISYKALRMFLLVSCCPASTVQKTFNLLSHETQKSNKSSQGRIGKWEVLGTFAWNKPIISALDILTHPVYNDMLQVVCSLVHGWSCCVPCVAKAKN